MVGMGMTEPLPAETTGCSYRYYECDSTDRHTGYVSHGGVFYASQRAYQDWLEQLEKEMQAEASRRRNLGYLWKPDLTLKRKRFRVHAPATRFIPCWSARRWKSRT